ncbi:glycosyltransferase family 2 protein [Capillimicrobium parvum]|uniref:Mycofactocin biosynthesis glycosyltransferase MftF n=1 Tax=Capillimicrobium parvum TaxID=2884022 RepID=A0A9E7C1F1_9ACTN|nr:glycosyltransferase family 2 protein [Capillimicrobium parvum]UGS37425.1 Putative mycofactocin biosynthesis glycosyltransferase MftF [Capillimicrobium parvum]
MTLRVAAVVPNWNGARWLPGCLAALRAQERPFDAIVVVDNGSVDESADGLGADVRVVRLGENRGFAVAANRGIDAAVDCDAVALVNSDVVLAPDWLARTAGALGDGVAAVASKMVALDDPGLLDDTGDFLRRDGVCEQRGRGRRDDGRWDAPGEVFAACAGAALYRRAAVLGVGGFDERLFSYLEDVDLGLRLRLAGWRVRYEPAVARHAGGGSAHQLERPVGGWVARNTLLIVAKAFPARWAGPVLYRQAAWLVAAARGGALRAHLSGLASALALLPAMLRERQALRAGAVVPIEAVVDDRPWRGPRAGGHPRAGF